MRPCREQYLYDLHCDPHELHNLVQSTEHADILRQLSQVLAEHMKEAGEPVPRIVAAQSAACAGV